MRFLIIAAVLSITACSKEEAAAPALPTGTYAGVGRDTLCIAGSAGAQRAGFVIYGANDANDANCSASGQLEAAGERWTLIPSGDLDCRIPLGVEAGRILIGPVPRACAYYCGPDVMADGKSFSPAAQGKPPVDLAGDQLC